MSCCGRKRDDVDVSDSVKVRFPKVHTMDDLVRAIRYAMAKTEDAMSGQRGVMKADLVLNIIDLLMDEAASDEMRDLYKLIGGRAFVESSIQMMCHAASKGKKISKGV
jgi:hypothetical protein